VDLVRKKCAQTFWTEIVRGNPIEFYGWRIPRAGGRRNAIRNKKVQIPRRWHRRSCRAPQDHRPDQLGSRSALATPWARLVSHWGHQGLCFRVLDAHFGQNFAHILHAGWRAVHHGVNFRNSDIVEVRVHSQRQYLTGFGR
jgi:hypothetical protein